MLDFVEWLNYYYFVLLDSFPFSLHFLTSLIKVLLGFFLLKFFYREKTRQGSQGWGWGGGGCPFWEGLIGSCPVSMSTAD